MNDTRRRQGGDAPLTDLEMRAAQLALMLTPAPRDAKYYGLPEDAVATAVAKHLSKKQGFEARIPWPPSLFPVEVRDSPFHGKGVFVTKDVECGQLLTLYPPDAFAFAQPAEGGREWFHVSPDIEHDVEEVFEALHAYAFSLGTSGGVHVHIVGLPRLCNDPAYMAHFANDPVGDARSEREYLARVAKRGNAYLTGLQCGLCIALFARKRIRAGEEVLVPYAYDYWKMRSPPVNETKVATARTHTNTRRRTDSKRASRA